MDDKKYCEEVETLGRFFRVYCGERHSDAGCESTRIEMKNGGRVLGSLEIGLCEECAALLRYAVERLDACPFDPKPRCRRCSQRCYGKTEWKRMAAVMRYSGMRLGVVKLRNLVLKGWR